MIGAILGMIGTMVGYTAIGVAEQELREKLGRSTRKALSRLAARLNVISERISTKKSKISEIRNALQAVGINVTNAATSSKLRASRAEKTKKLREQDDKLDQQLKEVSLDQSLVDQSINDSYTYGGALAGKATSIALDKKVSQWEDKING